MTFKTITDRTIYPDCRIIMTQGEAFKVEKSPTETLLIEEGTYWIYDKESPCRIVFDDKGLKRELTREEADVFLENDRKRNGFTIVNQIADFLSGKNEEYQKVVPTRFAKLDNLIDGGLFPGLYTLGAISGLGKTTLAIQIMDNLAQQGKNVLFFSLEMDAKEIIAKSLSRLSYFEASKTNETKHALSYIDILKGKERTLEEEKYLMRAMNWYVEDFSPRIFIKEGVGDIGVKEIRETIKEYMKTFGEAPVVIIDYLQILQPYSDKMTDKQNVDKTILELKRISRDFKTPVLAISSINRGAYKGEIEMSSLKESGSIEYSSDNVFLLQTANPNGKEEKELKEENRRKTLNGEPVLIELKIAKNRHGLDGSVFLSFNKKYNYFVETKDPSTNGNQWH